MDFFTVTHDVHEVEPKKMLQKKHRLSEFSEFLGEDLYVQAQMGWNKSGLFFAFDIEKPFEDCFYPEYRKGDSVELFIDTRDLKSAGFVTRFCHHFVAFPNPIEDVHAREVSTFRTEDRHELCDPSQIKVVADFRRKNYRLEIVLPSECLYGYDPSSFERIGFTYRINSLGKDPNHFVVSSEYLSIEQHPNRWASMQMRQV